MAQGINVSYPIVKGNTGFFKQTFNTLDAVKSKIHVLLNTDPGERVFNPNFGLGMRRYLFEPIDDIDELKTVIEDKINKYIPEVYIANLEINKDFNNNVDQNRLVINISFFLKMTLTHYQH